MNKALIGGNGFQYDTATGEGYLNGQIQQGGNRRPNEMFGRYGLAPTQDANDPNAVSDNPYWERTTTAEDDTGHSTTSWRQNQAYNDYMTQHGLTGVSQLGHGGFREVKNPGDVTWDENFGLVTTPENMGAQDPASRNRALMVRNLILLAGAGAAAGGAMGMAEFGGTGAATTGAATTGAAAEGGGWAAGGGFGAGGIAPEAGALGSSSLGAGAGAGTPALGSLGSGTSLAGTGLSSANMGALGTGGSLTGTGLVSGTGAGLAGTAATAGEITAGTGALGGLSAATGGAGVDWMSLARNAYDMYNSYQNSHGSNSPNAANDRQNQYMLEMWQRALQANSPNQSTPWGSSTWTVDPATGQRTQTQTLNAQDQGRLDQFRNIAGGRMNDASHLLQPDWARINPRVANMMAGNSFGGTSLHGGQ